MPCPNLIGTGSPFGKASGRNHSGNGVDMNTRWMTILICGALCLPPAAAMADDDPPCPAIYEDSKDELAIGSWPMGTPAAKIMSRAELDACSAMNGLSDDCYYRAPEGVDYILWRDDNGDGDVADATLKAWMMEKAGKAAVSPPLGLEFGWTEEQVRKKLPAGLPALQSSVVMNPNIPNWLETEACIRSSLGKLWRLRLGFDKAGRLQYIGASQRGFFAIT